MDHRDAEMLDLIVIIDPKWDDRMSDAIQHLESVGLSVTSIDDDNGVVEGTLESTTLAQLKQLDCVDYVRTVFEYVADYPSGDPRDCDNPAATPPPPPLSPDAA